MKSAYQRNAKTERKAAGEMKLKTIFAYREGHLSTDIEKEILRIFPQTIPRPQSGRKGILRKYTQYLLLGKGKGKNEIKKRNTLNNS